ncbi:hypothetical protein [Endozoicomonas montiporae]|uniref:Lipoprotein n=1 Tax=Endozoicomonas montiporae CL-33 TaxID=570277 RepID=A0A142B8C6_9GAMM|nr:hypothetical protein [Endozoicomonas montiporae]AMO55002.1 hypothetical protein EZMO1_0776 [Endozoicomonas montiporae CL-33]
MQKFAALVFPALLAGCDMGPTIRYRYFPPTTDNGLLCVAICKNSRTQCREYAQSHYEQCRMQEKMRRMQEENCRLRSKDKEAASGCFMGFHEFCSSPNTSACERDYDQCYQDCGGEVEAYVVE